LGLNAVGHLNSACCNISDISDYKKAIHVFKVTTEYILVRTQYFLY